MMSSTEIKKNARKGISGSKTVYQKNGQALSRRPGITTMRKKAQLISVKTLMNFPPWPG